jgi:hypothetical protein
LHTQSTNRQQSNKPATSRNGLEIAEPQRVEKRTAGPFIGPATTPTPTTLQQVSKIITNLQTVTKKTIKIQKKRREYVEIEGAALANIIKALERVREILQTDTTTGLLKRINANIIFIKEKIDIDKPFTSKI